MKLKHEGTVTLKVPERRSFEANTRDGFACADAIKHIEDTYGEEKTLTVGEFKKFTESILERESDLREGLKGESGEQIAIGLSTFFGDAVPSISVDLETDSPDTEQTLDHPDFVEADIYFARLNHMAAQLLMEHLKDEKTNIFTDPTRYEHYLFVLNRILANDAWNSIEERDAIDALVYEYCESHYKDIEQLFDSSIEKDGNPSQILSEGIRNDCANVFLMLLEKDAGGVPGTVKKLRSILNSPDRFDIGRGFQALFAKMDFGNEKSSMLTDEAAQATILILQHIGLSPFETMKTWLAVSTGTHHTSEPEEKISAASSYRHVVYDNLRCITDIESKTPGVIAALHGAYGITTFSRYSSEILLAQYEERDIKGPYGIIVMPAYDHNGALSNARQIVESLRTQLGNKMRVRIIECNGKRDLARRLISLREMHGKDGTKIAFAVIGAHGSPTGIELGISETVHNDQNIERFSDADFGISGMGRLAEKFFNKNATVILDACSTGTTEGFAFSGARETGLTFIGPDKNTFLQSMKVGIGQDGNPTFSVKYGKEANTMVHTNGSPEISE